MKKSGRHSKSGAEREQLRQDFYHWIDSGGFNINEAVRRFRKLLAMNQREFAKHVGISARILMAFEQGSGNPTIQSLEKMLKGSGLKLSLRRKSHKSE